MVGTLETRAVEARLGSEGQAGEVHGLRASLAPLYRTSGRYLIRWGWSASAPRRFFRSAS